VEELKDHGAVVIGAGGIGRGIALSLAREGMHVAVSDLNATTAELVASEIRGCGDDAVAMPADATSVDSIMALAGDAVRRFGDVRVVVSTVGVITDRRLEAATEEDWAWFFEFNVMANVRIVNAFLPHMRAAGGGHIVLTSSMAGLLAMGPDAVGGIYNGLYTTTKHALIGYTDMLRGELASEDIGVSVLCPGLVAGRLSITSAENRPARYGGPTTPPYRRQPLPGAMPGDDVGPIVVRGIKSNRFYIFTHPESAPLVERRHAQLLDDFAFYSKDS
jgi:NAD(P)-dependent dehydrogenase (short-subunit alcohol dehydrogenase family)